MSLAKTTKIIIAIDLSSRVFLWIRDKDFGVGGVLWAVFWIAVYILLQRVYEYADRKLLTVEDQGTKPSDVLSPADKRERLARVWRSIVRQRQTIALSLALAILCGIVMLAPRYVQVPSPGGYFRLHDTTRFEHMSPRIDWDWVMQRSLVVILVTSGLLYVFRERGENRR